MSHKPLAYAFAQTLTERNLERYADLLHPDYINHNVFAAPGKAGSIEVFEGFLAAFPDFAVSADDVVEEGDTLVGRFRYRGTFTDAFMGYPPTGQQVELRSIDIWRVKDGQLVEHWDELNTLDFFTQLGAATLTDPAAHAATPATSQVDTQ